MPEIKTHITPIIQESFIPNIKIFGIGGAGGNVVSQLMEEDILDVDTIICNTDLKALNRNNGKIKIELGKELTRGMGAGARPEVGESAAEESVQEISAAMEGANMVFIAAGMGGGTGTGAAPVVARIAREKQILTIGIVTQPFTFEGNKRKKSAVDGVDFLGQYTDTLLVISNDKLLDASTPNTTFLEAFKMVDMVLVNAIKGITQMLIQVGVVNLDFADLQTVMAGMGRGFISRGSASGKDRSMRAVEGAMQGSLMENSNIRGAKGILVHVDGPADTSAYEIQEAVSVIEDLADEEAEFFWGLTLSDPNSEEVTITIIATGLTEI